MFEPNKALVLLRQKTAGLPRAIENLTTPGTKNYLSHIVEDGRVADSAATLYNRAVPNKLMSHLEGQSLGRQLQLPDSRARYALDKINAAKALSPGLQQAREYAAQAAAPAQLPLETRLMMHKAMKY